MVQEKEVKVYHSALVLNDLSHRMASSQISSLPQCIFGFPKPKIL